MAHARSDRRRPAPPAGLSAGDPEAGGEASGRIAPRVVAGIRLALVLAWTLPACLLQVPLLALPGRAKVRWAQFYWRVVTGMVGVSVRMVGTREAGRPGRAVVYASNHSSWLDIPVLGGRLPACFVAKDDVAHWPVIGWIALLGRTIFVSRRAVSTGRERDDMRRRLGLGDNLVLFPEGTSSDGARVLPFRSSFFSIAEPAADGEPPLIQPVSIVYDRVAGLPAGRAMRTLFAWYGDMDLAPHAWRLLQASGLRASVVLHAPLDPRDFSSRKALSQATWAAVAGGAAALRQNREVLPRPAPAVPTAPAGPGQIADAAAA